jgi:NAD(P)-dependent dehydrogenase (short-subunit alcohol dehydrogenase family)
MADGWTAADIPDQSGRRIVVTGANSGLGLVTARELARAGATVVLACRNEEKGRHALADVQAAARDASSATLEILDLADLRSVRAFAERMAEQDPRIHVLINNAGVMAPPRRETVDGFESQLATNHLGPFALTGLVLPLLAESPAPRVVTVSSGLHRLGKIRFDDLQRRRRYNNWLAYGQTKLANLLFCFELQRRAAAVGSPLLSVAAHPGSAATNLQFAGPAKGYERSFLTLFNRTVAQDAEMGALPELYAATVPGLAGATFIGPDGFMEGRGNPTMVTAAAKAYDEDAARRLWDESERLTGVHYDFSRLAVAA